MDLYSVGEMLVDFLPGSEPGSYIRNAGGAPANVAIAAARNGLEAAMCCSVGDDDFGRYLLGTLRENRVRCIRPGALPGGGHHHGVCLSDGGRGAELHLCPQAWGGYVPSGGGRTGGGHPGHGDRPRRSCSLSASPAAEATAKALHLGREMGRLVSFDVNYRDMMWNGSQEAWRRKGAGDPAGRGSAEDLRGGGRYAGGRGGAARPYGAVRIDAGGADPGRSGCQRIFPGAAPRCPGRRAHCADATGAGDAFWGGMLSQMRFRGVTQAEQLTEPLVQEALEYGNVSGWLCVQGRGAIPSLPTRQEIERHLV